MPMTKMYHSISGQIVGDTINSQTRSYLGDGFGNVVGTTNPDSTLQMWFVYRPYGSTASVTGTGVEPVVRWGGSRRMLVVDESNAEYGDARGGSYSVGEGQLTNGNYGEYELPGFPRDWNPLKRGEMPRLTPMPPYKKPPRKNPPPVEIIPPPRKDPPIPGPLPPRRGILPGNGDVRENIARLRFLVCTGCCIREAIGGGPLMPFVDLIGDPLKALKLIPEQECTDTDRFNIDPIIDIPDVGNEDSQWEEVCKRFKLPELLCKPAPMPGPPKEWLPDPYAGKIGIVNEIGGKCNKVICFVECGLQLNEGLVKAGHPSPWQYCGLEDDEDSCMSCCLDILDNYHLRRRCLEQCQGHYF